MGIEWTETASKHGISREDAMFAMQNSIYDMLIKQTSEEAVYLYIGHPHGQTDRYIEVLAAHKKPRTIVIFHVMPLSSRYRDLI